VHRHPRGLNSSNVHYSEGREASSACRHLAGLASTASCSLAVEHSFLKLQQGGSVTASPLPVICLLIPLFSTTLSQHWRQSACTII
jgi:hypothetical protein